MRRTTQQENGSLPATAASRKGYLALSAGLAVLGLVLLLARLHPPGAQAQAGDAAWRLTTDGRSRFAAWSPDGRTVLVNRWGGVVGDGATRQALSELWAVDLRSGDATMMSENAVHPAYAADGQRLAVLSFAGDARWQVRVLDLGSGEERAWSTADWRTPPAWTDGRLAFARAGKVWLISVAQDGGAPSASADLPAIPAGARVRLSVQGGVAWSDGARLLAAHHPGQKPRPLVAEGQVLDFVWSPDGRRLAYLTAGEGLSPALWVADVSGERAPTPRARGGAEMWSAPTWSPDGQRLAFSRAPLGAETASASDIWLVDADGEALRPLLRNHLEESSPAWSPDGRYLAFNRAGDVWVMDVNRPPAVPVTTAEPLPTAPDCLQSARSNFPSCLMDSNEPTRPSLPTMGKTLTPLAQQTPPGTIRVIHRAENTYRSDVPVGQIDVIPFETYVKRAVPVEVYASWPMETLKVQAVAARTYAWYYTQAHAGWDWDVSDWVDYQAMGGEDQRHPRSDAATDATQGQYVAYQGQVIKAFYSAENGSPTRGLEGYDYIQPIDDPVSFGQERRGHGWGMSQWGAYRWAAWHGWSYQQILDHYYTGVTVELPSTGGPMPVGHVTLPWSDHYATGSRVYVAANASDESSDVRAVGFYAALADAGTGPTLLVTDTVEADGWSTVWDVSALSDTASTAITLSLRVADGDGNVRQQADAVRIGLDRRPPTETTVAIGDPVTDTLTITLSSLAATDPSPGSGVQAMAFSNEGWTWEGEDLYHQSGEAVADADALNGTAWRGVAGTHGAGAWYGPYTHDLPPGRVYRAYFRLKTNDASTPAEVATLDVVDEGGTSLLGLRRLRGTDFRAAGVYQEFPVDFDYAQAGSAGLEFRTAFRATADLYLDRVLIVGYPVDVAPSAQWRLTPGEGLKTVTVKFIDGAGNVSADLTATVTLSDTSPPTGWRDFAARWSGDGSVVTCSVRVRDKTSGLNVDSARYRFSTDEGVSWSDWAPAACTGISGTTELQTITAPSVPFGEPTDIANRIEFHIADMKGYTSTAAYTVHIRLLYLPLVVKENTPRT